MAWVAGLVALYLLGLVLVAWFSIHPPRIPVFLSPGSLGTPQEEVVIDGRLRGWWVQGKSNRVAVFCHGYLMNRAEMTPVTYLLWQHGYSCLLFDFRAHGRSAGRKSTVGYDERLDVAAAVAFARERQPGSQVVLVGSSMGAAASALAAGDRTDLADALVLDSCYGRLSSAILGWWRFVGGRLLQVVLAPVTYLSIPLAGLNPNRIDVSTALAKISMPVLLLHGDRDCLALPAEAVRNFEACGGMKRLVWFEGCGHSEGRWLQPERYNQTLIEFLEEHLGASTH